MKKRILLIMVFLLLLNACGTEIVELKYKEKNENRERVLVESGYKIQRNSATKNDNTVMQ